MTSPDLPMKRGRTRWMVAMTVATLCVSLISGAAHAGENAPSPAPADRTPASPATDQGGSAESAGVKNGETPSLQIQDEGPPAGIERTHTTRMRLAPVGEAEERPFWKSPVFWVVAGALVAGAIGMLVYSSSGAKSDLAPCPVDVEVSLGCFGAGR